ELSEGQLFAWYLVFAITVRSLLTLFTVPHMALGAELTADYGERTTVATYRNTLGYIGGLTIQVVAWFLIIPAATSAGNVADGYRNVGYFAAALALFGMVVAFLGTRERIPYLEKTSSEQQGREWWRAFVDIVAILKHHSVFILFIASLLTTTRVGVGNTMLLHINNFIYGFSSEQMGIFMLVVFFALFPAFWLATVGVRRLGKKSCLLRLMWLEVLVAPMAIMAFLYGFAPDKGSAALVAFVCFFVVLHQALYIAGINVYGAMLPDVADEIQVASGMRQEGMLNSAMMLTQKVSFGLGSFIAGLCIDYAGFEGVTEAAQVTSSMAMRLGWLYGPGLVLFNLVAIGVYTRYRLSKERHAEIRSHLAADEQSGVTVA
ncbi:MAG: MFS transporter, partial [Halioglobus sp.]|nr:MFS transporter [Halioglobus sp.]